MQKTKDVVVYANQVPTVYDVMALIHKLPFLDFLAFAEALGVQGVTEIGGIATEVENYLINIPQEAAPPPNPNPAVPPWPIPVTLR